MALYNKYKKLLKINLKMNTITVHKRHVLVYLV